MQDPPKFAQIGIFGSKIYVPSGNPARESALIKIELAAAEKKLPLLFHHCLSPSVGFIQIACHAWRIAANTRRAAELDALQELYK